MAKRKGPPQRHPDGPLIDIDPAERDRLKDERLARGLRQEDLAAKAGVTPATISNIESGRSKQVRRKVYARVVRALRVENSAPSTDDAATIRKLVDDIIELSAADRRIAESLIESLKKRG